MRGREVEGGKWEGGMEGWRTSGRETLRESGRPGWRTCEREGGRGSGREGG